MIVEFLEVTFIRHGTCKLLYDTSLALARSSPTRRYTGMVPKQYPLLRPTFWYLICCATRFGSRDNSKYHAYPLTQPPTNLRPT